MIDQATSSDDGVTQSGFMTVLSRMGERVASLEAKHEALKDDTQVIRLNIHQINNELQKIVVANERNRQSLQHLTHQVGLLVTAAPAIASAVATFEGMRADLKAVIDHRQRGEGRLNAMHEFVGFLRGVLPWLVALAGVGVWAWQNIALR